MILGFKPIQSVYFQFYGVTRTKKKNVDKFPTFNHFYPFFSQEKVDLLYLHQNQ